VTIKEIADVTASERSVLSRKLRVMEKNGWIKSEYVYDTREKAYRLSDKGKQLVQEILPIRLKVQNDLLKKLSLDEQSLLMSLCEKLQ
ncbi:MAG: winged helix DNA-binding protein, partial [Gammaproteobacteria bacterium]|nr:winged helix DNA-binding protein [Gammaproteobacteria bacterium]